jgi:ABC-type uncharacterized transport system YnjBCD permease subunit
MNYTQTQKGSTTNLIILLISVALIAFLANIYFKNGVDPLTTPQTGTQSQNTPANTIGTTTPTTSELMLLTVFIQDKEAARVRDCRITKKVTYQVLKTSAVADASLKLLFRDELSRYGIYKSVTITDGVAKVMLQSDKGSAGYLTSLTSCEVGHLLSVLNDTLKQYKTITKVELYSPEGRIEF